MAVLKQPRLVCRLLRARERCSPAYLHTAAADSSLPPPVPLSVAAFGVWGANTGVGKTLVCSAVAAAEAAGVGPHLYLKPLQTGWPADSDGDRVARAAAGVAGAGAAAHTAGRHAALCFALRQAPSGAARLLARTLFAWREAVGPHAAVALEGRSVADAEVVSAVASELHAFALRAPSDASPPLALVEAAGGVCSPSASGALQCDVMRALRLPVLLVADPALGGISTTLCALEALAIRGYDVATVVLLEGSGSRLRNSDALRQHLPPGVPLFLLPAMPAAGEDAERRWIEASREGALALAAALRASHERRVRDLSLAPERALRTLWWPFTQHERVRASDVTVVDARYGDALLAHDTAAGGPGAVSPLLDACSSWWTQGVSAAEQPALARAIGHAAGRWGHVMFPENAHAPALRLAERLLALEGCEGASRVFFSDNGSTAVEVALKMALRLRAARCAPPAGAPPRRVLALAGSYHGDTLGAALAQAPSVFTSPRQAPWYTDARGVFLQAPTCRRAAGGGWEVTPQPGVAAPAEELRFADAGALFDGAARDGSRLAALYRACVEAALDAAGSGAEVPGGAGAVGACILEPALQGAGGMQLVDPAFQRALVAAAHERSLPVIFDEVFSGLWRLGAPTGAALLGVRPELLCMGKLLTGGALPLAATLASEEAFDAFRGASALDALLHGHSFAGSAVGCAAALQALGALAGRNANMDADGRLCALWRDDLTLAITRAPGVRRVTHLGTVFAVELHSEEQGYRSNAARLLVGRLRRHGIFARPLGDVVYLMVTPMAPPSTCDRLLAALQTELHTLHSGEGSSRSHTVV